MFEKENIFFSKNVQSYRPSLFKYNNYCSLDFDVWPIDVSNCSVN